MSEAENESSKGVNFKAPRPTEYKRSFGDKIMMGIRATAITIGALALPTGIVVTSVADALKDGPPAITDTTLEQKQHDRLDKEIGEYIQGLAHALHAHNETGLFPYGGAKLDDGPKIPGNTVEDLGDGTYKVNFRSSAGPSKDGSVQTFTYSYRTDTVKDGVPDPLRATELTIGVDGSQVDKPSGEVIPKGSIYSAEIKRGANKDWVITTTYGDGPEAKKLSFVNGPASESAKILTSKGSTQLLEQANGAVRSGLGHVSFVNSEPPKDLLPASVPPPPTTAA